MDERTFILEKLKQLGVFNWYEREEVVTEFSDIISEIYFNKCKTRIKSNLIKNKKRYKSQTL